MFVHSRMPGFQESNMVQSMKVPIGPQRERSHTKLNQGKCFMLQQKESNGI